MKKGQIGSSFEEFLDEMGEREEVEALALKKIIAYDLQRAMEALHLSVTQVALRAKTTRRQVYRTLDPSDSGMTLQTLDRISKALDCEVSVEIRPVAYVERRSASTARLKLRAEKLDLGGKPIRAIELKKKRPPAPSVRRKVVRDDRTAR